MSEIIVSPSILSADFANLERDIKLVEQNGANWIHVDVMDGHFVPNITIGAPVVKSLRKTTKLPLDVHLMIENPQKYVPDFAKAGADIITFHFEAVTNVKEIIQQIKSYGIKAGISIKPKTNPEEILEFLPDLDLVLVMTVEPGFGGQSFMVDCAKKIKVIKEYIKSNPKLKSKQITIQVDGGINDETAKICTKYGATSLVAGSYIYNSKDIKSAINALKN